MLATLADADMPVVRKGFVFEPKYDGIRALVQILPKGRATLWSRNGNEKTSQFPSVVRRSGRPGARLR